MRAERIEAARDGSGGQDDVGDEERDERRQQRPAPAGTCEEGGYGTRRAMSSTLVASRLMPGTRDSARFAPQ
jgi:hypothetical protein